MNTVSMLVKSIKYQLRRLLQQPTITNRRLAQINGLLAATTQAILPARLNHRNLEHQMIENLRATNHNWTATLTLDPESQTEIKWWIYNIDKYNGQPLVHQLATPQYTLMTDASNTGWGHSDTSQGLWTSQEQEFSINYKELKAILFAFI